MSIRIKNTLVVITWDGVSNPLNHILIDTDKKFDLLIYDYSGKADINNFENIVTNDRYFASCGHLNNEGAIIYTNHIINTFFK